MGTGYIQPININIKGFISEHNVEFEKEDKCITFMKELRSLCKKYKLNYRTKENYHAKSF